jgi:hypothetical protein
MLHVKLSADKGLYMYVALTLTKDAPYAPQHLYRGPTAALKLKKDAPYVALSS